MDASTIELLRYGGYVFAVFSGLLFILAVFFFFKLKIRSVFYELSGKGRSKMTEKMAESYAVTGTLRSTDISTGQTGQTGKTGGTSELGSARNTTGGTQTGQISHARKVSRNKSKSANLAGFSIEKELIVVHTNERIQ